MTQPNPDLTPVLFRVFKDGGDVIALFPTEPGDCSEHTCSCFQHEGQHGSANLHAIIAGRGGARSSSWYESPTRTAFPEEYAALKRELESAPYNYRLRVIKRVSQVMHDERRAALRAQRAA